MTSQRTIEPNRGNRRSLWDLPQVLEVSLRLARYPEPRTHFVGTERFEASEAVELLVRTASEIPARALSPALFVGGVPIVEYELAGPNQYRFYAFDFRRLPLGAPISLGWLKFPERRQTTPFRFQLPGELPLA